VFGADLNPKKLRVKEFEGSRNLNGTGLESQVKKEGFHQEKKAR